MSAAQEALKILISGEVDPRFNSAFDLADRKLAMLGKDIHDLKKKQDLLKRFEMSTAGIENTEKALKKTAEAAEDLRRKIAEKMAAGSSKGMDKLQRDLETTENHLGQLGEKITGQRSKWESYQKELKQTGANLKDLSGEAERTAMALDKASKQHVRLENATLINKRLEAQSSSSVSAAGSSASMRNLAMGGAAAGYAANRTIFDPALDAATANEKSVRDIAITGGFAKTEKEEQLRVFANQASIDYYQKSGDVIETMASLVSQGLDDVSEIKEYAKNAAQAATAWNGNAVEMADLQFAYKKQLGLSKEDMRAALNITATGASQGSFEIKDMAKDMPVITSLLANVGMMGKDAVASGVAALETVRDVKGSSNETTTALAELLRQITSKETANAFKNVSMSKGRVLTEADKKAGEKGADIQSLLKDRASQGMNTLEGFVDIAETYMKAAGMAKEVENLKYAKNDEEKAQIISKLTEAGALSELVSSSEASSALLALIAKKGRYTDIKGKGIDSASSGDKLQSDFELSADTTSKQMEKVSNKWSALLDTIGTAMRPGTEKTLDLLIGFMDKAGSVATGGADPGAGFDAKGMGKSVGNAQENLWHTIFEKSPDATKMGLGKGILGSIDYASLGKDAGAMVGSVIKTAYGLLGDGLGFIWNNKGSIIQGIWEIGKGVVSSAIDFGVGLFAGFVEGTGLDEVATHISTWASGVLDGIKVKAGEFSDWVTGLWSSLLDGIKTKANDFSDWVTGLWDSLIGGIRTKVDEFGKWWDEFSLKDLLPSFNFGIFDTARDYAQKFSDWWNGLSLKSLLPDPQEAAKKAGEATGNMINAGMGMVKNVQTAITLGKKSISSVGNWLGSLSEKYESKGDAGAIGFDKTGGWSYGKYQVATKTGTMGEFLKHLSKNNPEMAAKLNAAGGSAGAESGSNEFKSAWKDLSKNDAFATAQHDFIKATHYNELIARVVKKTGLDVEKRSKALQDVFWSTSVQHGGNTNVVEKALNATGKTSENVTDSELITAIYKERGTRFGRSTAKVRQSVLDRFLHEETDAKSMLSVDGKRRFGGPVGAGGFYEVNEGGMPELLQIFGKQFLMMGSNDGMVKPLQNKAAPLAIGSLAASLAMSAAAAPAAPTVNHNNNATYTIQVIQQAGESQDALVRRIEKMLKDMQRPSNGALYDHWGH